MTASLCGGRRVVIDTDVMVPMPDGATLATNVHRTDGDEPRPALLSRLPYGKDIGAIVAHPLMPDPLALVAAGYVVVVQDVRGTGRSPGAFDPMVAERSDGAATIAWVADQPWCDGRVAMYGASYLGVAQWLAAGEAANRLHAFAPVFTSPDPYGAPWYHDGAFALNTSVTWASSMSLAAALRADAAADGQLRDSLQAAVFDTSEVERRLPLVDQPLLSEHAPWYDRWLRASGRDGFWDSVSALPGFDQIRLPGLHIAGWYDMFLGPALKAYVRLRASDVPEAVRTRQWLLVGPWSHANLTGVYAARSFGHTSAVATQDITGRHLRFFDEAFGRSPNQDSRVRIFVMGADVWKDESDWPPPDVRYVPYFLDSAGHANTAAGDGVLSPRPAERQGRDRISYDPRDPVPTLGGALFGVSISDPAGPADQSEVERLESVLCYTTPPLDRDLEATGPVEVVVYVSSTAADTDITAKLVDVFPDGQAINLTDGITRCRHHLDTQSGGSALVPGRVYELRVDLWATSNLFRRGHRIRLEVSSSNFPRFDRNSNTGREIALERTDDFVTAVNTVHHGAEHPSRLLLPVIDRR